MTGQLELPCRRRQAGGLVLLYLAFLAAGGNAAAQAPSPPPPAKLSFSESPQTIETAQAVPVKAEPPSVGPTAPKAPENNGANPTIVDPNVQQAQCAACMQGGVLSPYGGPVASAGSGCASCGCGMRCTPGREQMPPCDADNCVDRFFCNFYQCVCCPDPCYEGKWTPLADSAFFVDSTRPETQTRIRIEPTYGTSLPDRAEFFWAEANGMGKGPKPPAGILVYGNIDHTDTFLYQEAAAGKVGVFVEMSYLSVDPSDGPHTAGFGDMNTGVKTLLLDCEMLQVGIQFRTYIPVGNAAKGLGTGHVSLEPSLLATLKVNCDNYIEAQLSEWCPVGGDPGYAGAVLHYHFSCNELLCELNPKCPLVGTMEFNGWSFQNGSYTDPFAGSYQGASGRSYLTAGPGIRLFVCDKFDLGVGIAFSLQDPNMYQTQYRTELRIRF